MKAAAHWGGGDLDGGAGQLYQHQDSAVCRQMTTETRSVSWYEVAEFALPLIERCGPVSLPGSLAWCRLSQLDPRKLAGCLVAAMFWALDESARQDAGVQGSQAISLAFDWSALARRQQQRAGNAYIPRRPA
jgi:hypothetical protein